MKTINSIMNKVMIGCWLILASLTIYGGYTVYHDIKGTSSSAEAKQPQLEAMEQAVLVRPVPLPEFQLSERKLDNKTFWARLDNEIDANEKLRAGR